MLRHLLRAACAAQLLFLVTILTPLSWLAGLPLRMPSDAAPSDAIVLFSSGQIGDDWLSMDAAQRLLGALDLYRRGFAPVVAPSGSLRIPGQSEAELAASWLERAGVPASDVVIENRSTRTYESVVAVREMMRARGWTRVVIVSSDMDILRIRLVCDRLGVRATYLGVPQFPPPGPHAFLYFSNGYAALYHAAYEYAGLALYWWRGWI